MRIFILTAAVGVCFAGAARLEATPDLAFFEAEVRPLLKEHCYSCHSEEAGKRKGGLWLDRREGWEIGGDAGPSLVPGKPEESLLIHTIRYQDPSLQMPPKTKLPSMAIATLEKWVQMGAPDPRDAAMAGAVRKEAIDYEKARQEWAVRPLQVKPVAEENLEDWSWSPSDRYVERGFREAGLSPAPDADPAELIRRVYYDLTGLPPSREEVIAFVDDPSRERFATIVDDLLARPGFGEKWGRHWLDVARYADSNGGDRNFTFYQAWRYRNWVIDSLNQDRSYYDFVRAQIAGDLLPSDTPEERAQGLIGSTFLALGPKMLTERDKEKLWMDTVDEQLDTVGRAFLGLTLGCARCHDHKFDPVSQEDYYAMAGIFRSTEVVTGTRNGCVNVASWIERPLPVGGKVEKEVTEKVERLELAMRLTVEKSFKKKAGNKMTAMNLPLAGVVYDDSDAELIGEWKTSTLFPLRIGPSYVHDDKKGKGEKRVVFRGSLPESGIYEVRIAYSADERRSTQVPVTVLGKGREKVILDQTRTPRIAGLFEPLGQFEFEKGGECRVIIDTEGTDEKFVIVDAVQFIAVKDIPREAEAIEAMDPGGLDPLLTMSEGELKKTLGNLIQDLKDDPVVMAPRDAEASGDVHLRVRGEVGQLGPQIPRNFLQVLHDGPPPEIAEGESGRLQMAEWLVKEENALLDRVIVNRIWHHLFGRGIVATVDNFGRLGSGPSHPELLDFLAHSFRESGGSFKGLIRELVLSRAYQLETDDPELQEQDPSNQWFARQNHRRLTAEEIRDSALFFSGELDREPAEATATPYGVDLDKPFNFSKSKKRTVYLPVARNNPATELAVFDAANPDLVSGNRPQTTVPTQALYLLNSEFIHTQAAILGKKAVEYATTTGKPGEEVDWLYQTLLGRLPNPVESQRGQGLIADLSGGAEDPEKLATAAGDLAHVIMASTEFLYLD